MFINKLKKLFISKHIYEFANAGPSPLLKATMTFYITGTRRGQGSRDLMYLNETKVFCTLFAVAIHIINKPRLVSFLTMFFFFFAFSCVDCIVFDVFMVYCDVLEDSSVARATPWKYEPPHDKTNKMASAPSEDADQPGHPPSLISLRCALNG